MRLDGHIDSNRYVKEKTRLQAEEKRLEEALGGLRMQGGLARLELAERFNLWLTTANKWFRVGTEDTKRVILSIVGSNCTLLNGILLTQAKKPFSLCEKTASCSSWLGGLDSNQDY